MYLLEFPPPLGDVNEPCSRCRTVTLRALNQNELHLEDGKGQLHDISAMKELDSADQNGRNSQE